MGVVSRVKRGIWCAVTRLKVESCYSLSLSLSLSSIHERVAVYVWDSPAALLRSYWYIIEIEREREREEGEVPTGMTFVYINVRFEL